MPAAFDLQYCALLCISHRVIQQEKPASAPEMREMNLLRVGVAVLLFCVDTSVGALADSSPSPTDTSHCERAAAFIKSVTPQYPPVAHGAEGQVFIRVTLSDKGEVLATAIVRSSHNAALDVAAEKAARQSTYAPSYHECKPQAGSWLFIATFRSP